MFKYINVNFPETSIGPASIHEATFYQNRYEHEVAVLNFRDWGVMYDAVTPGSLVHITHGGTLEKREFYGYIHHIKVNRTPGKNFTQVVAISASFSMKQANQTIYKNMTADAIVKQIGESHGFSVFAVPSKRIYPQVSQAGHTDWEFMVRLAKQNGYSLRTENTELYFQPMLYDYTNLRSQAPKFILMPNDSSRQLSTIYSFEPIIGESIPFDTSFKAAVAVSGIDSRSVAPVSITQQIRNKKTKTKQQTEFFDRYATDVVVPDVETAQYEAQAAENRNTFPYRGEVKVLGEPNLRPDMPIYLEGVGGEYSGYWTILSAEHQITTPQRNMQQYVTVLTVGTDSLGSAATWTDNQTIKMPDYKPQRNIIANVRQTNVKPKTKIVKPNNRITPAKAGSFGKIKNRVKVTSATKHTPTWKSASPSLKAITKQSSTPAVISTRYKQAVKGK
jgi:phage protein D